MITIKPGETYKGHITRIRKNLSFYEGVVGKQRKPLPEKGEKKGLLTYLGILGRTPHGHNLYSCKCDCGKYIMVTASAYRGNRTRSCGCTKFMDCNESSYRYVYRNYRHAAKKRGISFDLDFETFSSLIDKNCFYCGKPASNSFDGTIYRFRQIESKPFAYNGVDRMFNEHGYNEENCVPCCKYCNRWKADMDISKFLEHCRTIYAYSMEGPKWDDSKYPSVLTECAT